MIHKACTHADSKQSGRYCRGKLPLQCSVVPFYLAYPCGYIYPIRSRRFLRGRVRRMEFVYSRILNCLPRTECYLTLTFKCKEELSYDGRNKIFQTWRIYVNVIDDHIANQGCRSMSNRNANYVLLMQMIPIYKYYI